LINSSKKKKETKNPRKHPLGNYTAKQRKELMILLSGGDPDEVLSQEDKLSEEEKGDFEFEQVQ
jgi:hypothetical protein